ncbi:UNVERIFIED_CONTAM: hypothetical protein Sindi_2543000, partial [Sesamum indicum]
MASSSTDTPAFPSIANGTRNHHMVMVSAPFNGINWLSWSRSIRIALESKDKLAFIDGIGLQPTTGTPQHRQWRITDCMVRTWILNTISKDLVNAYLYASSSRNIWLDLEARYGECDGTLLYKLQREISSICKLCVHVAFAFANATKTKAEQNDANQLIQFLMGLNDSYDNIRSQTLVLEPLSLVNKAYYMVLRVERQRMVNSEYSDIGE